METLGEIAKTPIPTILVIGGIFFLLLSVASIKGIKPSPQRQRLSAYFGIGLLIVGIALFLFYPNLQTSTTPPSVELTNTPAVELIPTDTFEPPSPETIFSTTDTYHIGDENRQNWAPLSGDCASFNFAVQLPILDVNVTFESYDANARDLIKINGSEVSIIPEQTVDETWSKSETIPLPSSVFVNGINILEFCAVTVTQGASHANDKDDFQIRNINVVVDK